MGRRRKNTFAKALGQLKSTKIDEKLQMLSERPTNSVMTYMTTTPSTLNPDFVSSQRGQDSALQFIQPDFDQDDPDQNGQDTTGLFEADGTPRTALPPGDTSYILGPMSAMWYGWANQTRIGYIREADRKMVNLGMISGTLDAWDGASNFTSFGQLTLEQAVWFKDVEKAPGQSNDPTTYNYRAFYPGPPSTTRDSFGRYYCVITGKAKSNPLSGVGEKEQIPGAGGKPTPEDNFAALLDRLKKGAKNIPWDEISKGLDIAMIAWNVAAVVGLLFPEPTTSALGAARLARHLRHFGKAKGLARGLKGMSVGATGLKRGGYQAIKGGAKHTGSRGILSGIGKKQVYSAPKVGKVGKSAWSPGTGASRYTKFQSNPLVQGKTDPGGIVGSIVPGGARKLNIIDPQAAVNPDTFSKGVRLFRKVMGGQYSKSATASKIRKQAAAAGFGGGKANIPFKNLLKQSFDISGNLIVEVMTTAGVTDPITNLDSQTESNINSKAQQFAAKVPDKDKNKWADLLGQWSIENTTGDQRYAAEIASINMENGGSIGALLGAGYLLWEGGKLIFNGMDDLKHKIFDPNKQEHLDRILEEVSLRTDNPTLMSIDEIHDAMYIIATRDEDWTVNKFDQLIEQDVDANRITQEISDAQDLLWTMRGTEYPGSPYLEPEFVRIKEDHWNKWDIMQANGGYEACRDKYWEGGKEIIESWYKAAVLHSDYHEKYVVPVWYKAIKDKEKEIEDMYASMTPIIERLQVDFVTAWQQENKLKFGDQYVAGVYGDAGMVDIDGKGWFVTPSQLFKMNDSPGNYNLSPREIRLIRGWVQNLRASLNPYGTPTETDAAVASWEKDWKKKKKKDDEETAALQVASYTQKGSIISESRKTEILKNLKNPVVIPETKKKSYKVKPKIRGLNSAIISKPVETPKEYQPKGGRNLWGQFEYNRNVRQSQERKNEVLDLVGEGEQAFKYMLNDSRAMNAQQLEKFWGLHPELYSYFYNGKKFKAIRKEALDGDFLVFLVDENGVKSNILQSELNEKLVEDEDRKALEEYNKLNLKPKRNDRISFEKDYLFKKAYQKLKKEVDYENKPSKMGYPNDPPPKMVNDRHPDFGKRPGTTMFNKLDPQSAEAMPNQDDPTIDAKVEKAKNNPDKDGSNWRKELEVKIKKHRQSIK